MVIRCACAFLYAFIFCAPLLSLSPRLWNGVSVTPASAMQRPLLKGPRRSSPGVVTHTEFCWVKTRKQASNKQVNLSPSLFALCLRGRHAELRVCHNCGTSVAISGLLPESSKIQRRCQVRTIHSFQVWCMGSSVQGLRSRNKTDSILNSQRIFNGYRVCAKMQDTEH